MYNARVKAFNSFCEGEYSEMICLQTAQGIIKYALNCRPIISWFNSEINMFVQFSIARTRSRTVAWFTFDPELSDASGSGLTFSNDLATVSVDGWDHRVALASVGFSRGIHYWEFTVNKYTADTDPAFGIARIDVARDQMLGELNKANKKKMEFM